MMRVNLVWGYGVFVRPSSALALSLFISLVNSDPFLLFLQEFEEEEEDNNEEEEGEKAEV